MTESTDRLSALIESFKKEGLSASLLSDDSSPCVVSSFLTTGCYVLDAIMGGGLPLGRIVEIYGDTSTGKSLIAAQACASIQEEGGIAVYIDTESAVSIDIMKAVGVDVDTLVYSSPDTVEDAFKAIETVIADETIGDVPLLIVWDSIAATTSKAEQEKETGETGYLTQARIISQGLRKNARSISKRKVALLLLNQTRVNIGVVFGDKVATFGGKGPGFYSSIRVELSVAEKIVDKATKRVLGIKIGAEVVKNKIAAPFRKAELPVYFGHGIDDAEAMFDFLKEAEIVEYSGGGWYSYHPLEGDEVKFKRAEWSEAVYDTHYAELCQQVDAVMRSGDLI